MFPEYEIQSSGRAVDVLLCLCGWKVLNQSFHCLVRGILKRLQHQVRARSDQCRHFLRLVRSQRDPPAISTGPQRADKLQSCIVMRNTGLMGRRRRHHDIGVFQRQRRQEFGIAGIPELGIHAQGPRLSHGLRIEVYAQNLRACRSQPRPYRRAKAAEPEKDDVVACVPVVESAA